MTIVPETYSSNKIGKAQNENLNIACKNSSPDFFGICCVLSPNKIWENLNS